MPKYLTAAAAAIALYVEAVSEELWTGIVPGGVVFACAILDYVMWERLGRPWHDWRVIVFLLPGIAAAVWIAVGGLVTGVERSDEARLLVEVGPGVALTGLLCTLISYHGRHPPDDNRAGAL